MGMAEIRISRQQEPVCAHSHSLRRCLSSDHGAAEDDITHVLAGLGKGLYAGACKGTP